MPTENQSSNEQKMVSVPGEPTNRQKVAGCEAYMEADGITQAMNPTAMGHAYRAMLDAAPVDHHHSGGVADMADQHQGEPDGHVYTMEAILVQNSAVRHHIELSKALLSARKLRGNRKLGPETVGKLGRIYFL